MISVLQQCYIQDLELLLSETEGAPQMQFILVCYIPRVVIAILLYGCESWRTTKGDKKRRSEMFPAQMPKEDIIIEDSLANACIKRRSKYSVQELRKSVRRLNRGLGKDWPHFADGTKNEGNLACDPGIGHCCVYLARYRLKWPELVYHSFTHRGKRNYATFGVG